MVTRPHQLALLAGASAALVAGGVLTATTAQAAVGCRVDYKITNQWQTGFGADVTITNLGDPVNGWRLAWTHRAGQRITQMWNAGYTESGNQVTATNVTHTASIPTNGSVNFGYNGTWTGSNPPPDSFTLNGVTCTGGVPQPTTPGPNPTTPGPNPTTPGPRPTTPAPPPPPPPPPPAGSCGSGTFQAEAVLSGSTWTARTAGRTVYTGGDMRAAMQSALDSLPRRTAKQAVVVRGSGSIGAGVRVTVPSYTILHVCGTINVTGSGSGDMAPIYARGATDIEIAHLRLTGRPLYGIFMRNVNNLVLGQIDMRLSGGLGVRIDNHGGDRAVKARNIRIDNVYVQGTSDQGVETYGVDGLTVGTVTARNTAGSGLLLNDTINATIGTVDGDGAGTGSGYAAFRMANRNGRIGSSYPTNIRVGTVTARGGGRGIFCVSESGGAVIDRINLVNTGGNAILVENCHNVTIAAQSGTVSGGGEVRIASRTEFAASSNNTFQNLTVTNNSIRLSPCGTNNVIRNVTRVNTSLSWC